MNIRQLGTKMRRFGSKLPLGGRTATVSVVVAATVLALGGWAVADGSVPLLSGSTDTTSTATSTSSNATTAAGQGATNNGSNNVAAAVNTSNGKSVFALRLKIVQTDSSTVDATNAAVAAASCSDCQTVAIALEAVLVAGSPTTYDPTNIALAINSGCNNCQTLATAYQDVVQHDTRVRITGAGRQQIASIRQDLDSLRNSGLDIFAIQQRVNEDAAAFLNVLQSDVVPIGQPTATVSPASTTTSTSVTPTTEGSSTSTSTSTSTSQKP
jgi:putative peptide zinc metalloprotease protein